MANALDSVGRRFQPSECLLKIAHENGYDLILNRLVRIEPEQIKGGPEGILQYIKKLKEKLDEFCTESRLYSNLLKRKAYVDEFKITRKQRHEIMDEVNQFIDLINMHLSSLHVEAVSLVDVNSISDVSESIRSKSVGTPHVDQQLLVEQDLTHNVPTVQENCQSSFYDPSKNSNMSAEAQVFSFQNSSRLANMSLNDNDEFYSPEKQRPAAICDGLQTSSISMSNYKSNICYSSKPAIHNRVAFSNQFYHGQISSEINPPRTLHQTTQNVVHNTTQFSQPFFTHTASVPPGFENINPTNPTTTHYSSSSIEYQNQRSAPNCPFQINEGGGQPSNGQMDAAQMYATNQAMLKYLVTNDLTKDSIQIFDGKSYHFWSWVDQINSKIGCIEISPSEIVHIMRSKSQGDPQKLINTYASTPGGITQAVFNQLWKKLVERFGSTTRIYTEIMEKFEALPVVGMKNGGPILQQLFDLCEIAKANKNRALDLCCLDRSTGLEIIRKKLPVNLQESWAKYGQRYEDSHGEGQHPPFEKFIEFLENSYRPKINPNYRILVPTSTKNEDTKRILKTNEVSAEYIPKKNKLGCPLHEDSTHQLSNCHNFKKMSHDEKKECLKKYRRCYKCTLPHYANDCRVKLECGRCQGKHHTVLHRDYPILAGNNPAEVSGQEILPVSLPNNNSFCTNICNSNFDVSCSKTMLVDVTHPNTLKKIRIYCILDDQSNCSLIDDRLLDSLGIEAEHHEYTLATVNGIESRESGQLIKGLRIKGADKNRWIEIDEAITNVNIPSTKSEVATKTLVENNPKTERFAKYFHDLDASAEVMMLVGRNCIEAMQSKCYTNVAPWVYETPIGWAVVGNPCPSASNKNKLEEVRRVFKTSLVGHEHFVAKNLPIFSIPDPLKFDSFEENLDDEMLDLSINIQKFSQIMRESVKINDQGRVEAPIPLKDDEPLPCNRWPVFHRTKNTLDRLKSKPKELEKCLQSIGDSLASGFMERVPDSEKEVYQAGKSWWLPIFAVWHPQKEKPRMVCDAAAKFQGICLNDKLLKGPDINHQLRALLQNVREDKIAIMADIETMFSNFSVSPADRDLLRFFWWDKNDPTQEIVQYRYTSHVFGCTSSPAVASWCLLYSTFLPGAKIFPQGSKFIAQFCYVDDLIGSVSSEAEAIECLGQAKSILDNVNIRLHKLMSNSDQVLEYFPEKDRAVGCKVIGEKSEHKTLGVSWNPVKDEFLIKVDISDRKFTKRNVLSTINSIYDPLGFVSPVVLGGRLIQRLVLPTKDNMTPNIEKLG